MAFGNSDYSGLTEAQLYDYVSLLDFSIIILPTESAQSLANYFNFDVTTCISPF